MKKIFIFLGLALLPMPLLAVERLDLTQHWAGYSALVLFALAYALVISEEKSRLRKSKPVVLVAGIIWAIIAFD
jgi:uncharacterized membrane protein